MSLIIKAARIAEKLHKGQFRKYTNRPYIEHPCRVATRLMLHPLATEASVAAAFDHDLIEDCNISIEDLYKLLNHSEGQLVCNYVQWLTNPSKGSKLSRSERKLMDREHLRNAPYIVQIIKMIDRIDNLNEMSQADPSFIIKYCEESRLLAEVIGDADNELYLELCDTIDDLLT